MRRSAVGSHMEGGVQQRGKVWQPSAELFPVSASNKARDELERRSRRIGRCPQLRASTDYEYNRGVRSIIGKVKEIGKEGTRSLATVPGGEEQTVRSRTNSYGRSENLQREKLTKIKWGDVNHV